MVKYTEFGIENDKTLMIFPGGGIYWNPAAMPFVETASKHFHLIVVAYDGFNGEEKDAVVSDDVLENSYEYEGNYAAAMDANEILKAATIGSARCMGLDNCDCIAQGKLADLTVIDLDRPNMQPINNITKNLVYSGSKDDVKMTVINGKILYENGEFMNIDKEEIYFNAQEVTNRLKK